MRRFNKKGPEGKGSYTRSLNAMFSATVFLSALLIAQYSSNMDVYMGKIIDLQAADGSLHTAAIAQNNSIGTIGMVVAKNETNSNSKSERELELELERETDIKSEIKSERVTPCIETDKKPQPLDILAELDILSGGPQAEGLKCPPPLVAIQNVIVRQPSETTTTGSLATSNTDADTDTNSTSTSTSTNGAQTRLVPRIIHFTFKDRCLPQDIAMVIEKWKQKFPSHSIFFHDNDAVGRLLAQDWPEFPELHRAMKCVMYRGAMTIDVWRILIVYKYGGIYSDIDVTPLEKFTEETIESHVSGFFFSDVWNRPTQWFFALEPRHPMLYITIFDIINNLYALTNIRVPKLVHVTGPMALRAGWNRFLDMATKKYDDRYKEMFHYEGPFNKTVIKLPRTDYVGNRYGYDDIVTLYNSEKQVTREERIRKESGMLHWKQRLRKTKRIVNTTDVSCREYLKKIDDDPANELGYFD